MEAQRQNGRFMEQTFSRRQVERSFRKFNDIVQDLFSAQFQTWGDSFNHLVEHCEQDPVMRVITEPLRSNSEVDAEEWYQEILDSQTGGAGSGTYKLPYDDDKRTALLYQFFLFMYDEEKGFSLPHLNIVLFGKSKYQDMISVFNQEIVQKFTREVSYRLEEILEDIGDEQVVTTEAMMVFHHHDYSMKITGNIEGSNLALGGSTISDSSAQSTKTINQPELLETLNQARLSAQALPDKERVKAEVLIEGIEEEVSAGQPMSITALHFAAQLFPLLEKAGNAAESVEKLKTFFGNMVR
jgi:hypothetical protein